LAHASPGDMHAYEEILAMVEQVTAQGLREYERDPTAFDLPSSLAQPSSQSSAGDVDGKDCSQDKGEGEERKGDGKGKVQAEQGGEEDEEESSIKAVRECHRPWWICQAYVRPLPKEALAKGSLSLGKKAKRKIEREEEEEQQQERERKRKVQREVDVEVEVQESEKARKERDERDGVPREEIPKEAMLAAIRPIPNQCMHVPMPNYSTSLYHLHQQCRDAIFMLPPSSRPYTIYILPISQHLISSIYHTHIVYLQQHLPRAGARTPLGLAPVGGATEIRSGTAEVASAAAKRTAALGVDNGTASITVADNLGGSSGRSRGLLVESALAEAALASSSTRTYIVLGTTVASRATAAVEVTIRPGARAFHAALATSANINVRDLRGVRVARRCGGSSTLETANSKWSGQSTPSEPGGGGGKSGLAAFSPGVLEVRIEEDGKRTAQLEPAPEKDFRQFLGSQ
ncbi:MAG: hypothetical protein Q9216_005016, partial [Gyalolechia sp. 2 TL-2023]